MTVKGGWVVLDEHGRPCDYRFVDINPAFERITGLTREKTVGKDGTGGTAGNRALLA